MKSSLFFQRALQGNTWIEGETGVVKLPEDDPEVFDRYVRWLYSGKVHSIFAEDLWSKVDKDASVEVVFSNYIRLEFLLLAKEIVLSDKLLDERYHNSVIDAIFDRSVACSRKLRWFPVADLAIIYTTENHLASANIKNLMMCIHCSEVMAFGCAPNFFDRYSRELLHSITAFIVDISKFRASRTLDGMGPRRFTNCNFHKHSSGGNDQCREITREI